MDLQMMKKRATLFDAHIKEGGLDFSDIKKLCEIESHRWKFKQEMLRRAGVPCASFLTSTNVELIYASVGPGTAKNTFTTEVQINDTAGMGVQAHLPADFWLPSKGDIGRGIHVTARGILSSTATPTYTFATRTGAAGSTTTANILGSAALTTGSGVSNQLFDFEGDVIMETIGAAGTNSTVRGMGTLTSGGLASPFLYPIGGGAASPWTVATVDTSITNFINFNVACSASSSSNTITLQMLMVFGLN
jgi:hypothetical protein